MIMGHAELFGYAARNLAGRKLRSYLTILGVVIGIASIVSIVSVGQGVSDYVYSQLMAFGTDFVSVQPGSLQSLASGPTGAQTASLTENDRKAVEVIGGVKAAYGQVMAQSSLRFGTQSGIAITFGMPAATFTDFSMYTLREGRYYRDNAGEAVIGADLADTIFDRKIRVGDAIFLNNASFRVVGILSKGSGLSSAIDSVLMTDPPSLMATLGRSKTVISYDEIDVKVEPGADPNEVGAAITERLRNLHHVTEDTQDFTVITPDLVSGIVGGILTTLNLFLGGLASIALVVGGVGIANTMFMAVTERTREIGILKAIGARNRDILEIFMFESGMIGLAGGLAGCLIGFTLSYVLNQFGVPSKVDLPLVALALSFSIGVGIVSGIYPARHASRLPPVEALRYE